MTTTAPRRPPNRMRVVLGPLASRPRMATAFGLGALSFAALSLIPNDLRWSTKALVCWDVTCAIFMALVLRMMTNAPPARIRLHAASQDEGQGFILTLALLAAAASVWAIGAELSLAKTEPGPDKVLRVALAFATVAASWIFVQTIFALHYAHEYYAEGADGEIERGLAFPGPDDAPDYWDFLHFAVVIGVASQTADIAFTSKGLRRVGTLHGVTAFVFNTVVLALTINLLAGLF